MNTYGDFFDKLMLARMKRDGISLVSRVAFDRNGRYAVRGYTRPNPHNSEEVYFYHLRRDGKVEQSWVPLDRRNIVEWHGDLTP